jgi:hypothetical protein
MIMQESPGTMVKLVLLMDLADRAFENYLENKYYLHALCIRKNNKAIYRFIIENAAELPVSLQPHFISLLNHYDIWMTQFEDFEKQRPFKLDEPFVFYHLDAKSAYPKPASAAIRSYAE